MIDVAFSDEIAGEFVVGGEGAIGGAPGGDERGQVFEVPFGAAFAQEDVDAESQFFTGFLEFGGFVIAAHAGEDVGVEIFPAQSGCVAVDGLAFARIDLGEFTFEAEENAGIIHQLGDAGDAFVVNHEAQVARGQPRAGAFERRGRDATGQHDEAIDGQVAAGLDHVANALDPEHVGVFMRVDDHRAGAAGNDGFA